MISDEEVADFLARHPDFLDRHPELLERLSVSHGTSGNAISLVEKQVKLLRDRQIGRAHV